MAREAVLSVRLLRHTPQPERAVAAAARLCYSPEGIDAVEAAMDERKVAALLAVLADQGHESPLEHASFTFGIEGVSRALTHQLVRHRIASYSQQSQRYVDAHGFSYVVPPSVRADRRAHARFAEAMERLADEYAALAKAVPREDARYVLPNAAETRIVVTMNARELAHFFSLRCCERAQWEIRALATEMLAILLARFPLLFIHAGPGCLRGPCTEGKAGCGRAAEVRRRFAHLALSSVPAKPERAREDGA